MHSPKDAKDKTALREQGKLYQDQLYGAKTLSLLAVAIIDTPEFQRLGGLRQLGFSEVVYRGARHSRLEHSIGTYLVCKQVMRRIVQNHERLNLEHPGEYISNNYRVFPANAKMAANTRSFQARWRGLTEVVSAASLLHDLGHVPFGHTLEDEFAGIFPRHDRLAGSRFYELLFNEESHLAKVFSATQRWLPGLANEQIRELIYLMLSWKEEIDPPKDFPEILRGQKEKCSGSELTRIEKLEEWYSNYALGEKPMFQPFMSDIVGNTICSDLLDYLPRDRVNLGMEARRHDRLQRYFTIRRGGLHHNEGYRMSIMVTRAGHGGQRRDVASAVLGIMRERFEMAEAVYYHHKKAAASAMLAKLAEISDMVDADADQLDGSKKTKPRDDDAIYPAPWGNNDSHMGMPPHKTHLSDSELIDYLCLKQDVKLAAETRTKQYK
jgi:HD superfamily phosphohydrolase